ncbi:MAG: phenylacetate--CoA ligase family protein [Thermoguttaceae bacterium]
MSADELQSIQNTRLKDVIASSWNRNNFFRKIYEEVGLKNPCEFGGISDLMRLPFSSKDDFRKTYPLGMCCISHDEIREMHMSSGSTGSPVVMPYSENDLDQWGECMARCFIMSGAKQGDPVQITPTFGLFNGGFGMYLGARKAGLFVIPASSGNTERQIHLAHDFGTRIFGGVVSYATRVADMMKTMSIDLPKLEIGIFGAEFFSDGMRCQIENLLGIRAFNIYGMTETGGVGTLGMDCQTHTGIHVWEDHYILEIIDPKTEKHVPDGEMGELVITSLTREALPVIRFRTGDLTRIQSRSRCDCGRTSVRIAPITGRTDDMLIIKGVNFFPIQVENALLEIPGVLPHYQIVIGEVEGVKDICIQVEAESGVTGHFIAKHLKERLGFLPKGDVFPEGTLPRSEGKAKRVIFRQ